MYKGIHLVVNSILKWESGKNLCNDCSSSSTGKSSVAGLLWESEPSARLHKESPQQPQMETLQRKPWRPHKSHDRNRHHKRSGRWSQQWCETINTQTPQSLHGHWKYRGCHWDRKKYNWAFRVHNVRVKCTAYRHFLDVGHTYPVMCEWAWKCTRPHVWIQEHGLFR